MKLIKATVIVSVLAGLGGCIAVPVGPGYYSEAPGYYAPAPAYYPAPVYYGPSVEIGVHRGWRGWRHRHYR